MEHTLGSMTLLSFLIPAYNSADVLDDAVSSALRQDIDVEMEVVIVDDGSSDSTAERAHAWATRHPDRVCVGRHDENRGGAAARNTAAALARGDLLYIVDADNVLSDGCVARQLSLMRDTGLDAISVGQVYYFQNETSNVTDGWVQRQSAGRATVRHMFESVKVPPAHGNYLFTRKLFDAVGGYSEDTAAMDTWTFGLKHLARGFEIGVDTGSYYFHRLNRPNHDSYWSREERQGTNDANAIRELRREADRLPGDLREMVMTLKDSDRFFSLVSAGAFSGDLGRLRDIRRLERIERVTLDRVRRATGTAARVRGRLLGR